MCVPGMVKSAVKVTLGLKYPTLRANPFPEVTDLFCRLPLSTLFYQPGCSPWRPAAVMSTTSLENYSFPWIFKERRGRTRPDRGVGLFQLLNPSSRQTDFRVITVKKKRELCPGPPPSSPRSVALPRKTLIEAPEY